MTCKYCGIELEDGTKTSCEWCNRIIQEANCEGIYLADAATAVSKRADLTTPDERRAAIQEKYNLYTGAG